MPTLPDPGQGPETTEKLVESIDNQNLDNVRISENQFRAAVLKLLNRIAVALESDK